MSRYIDHVVSKAKTESSICCWVRADQPHPMGMGTSQVY